MPESCVFKGGEGRKADAECQNLLLCTWWRERAGKVQSKQETIAHQVFDGLLHRACQRRLH